MTDFLMPPSSSQMALQLILVLISCSLYSMYPPCASSVSSSLPAYSSLALLILVVVSTCISLLLFSNLRRHLLKAHGAHKVQTTSPSSMDEVAPEEKSIVLEDLMGSTSESLDCTANDDERTEEEEGDPVSDDDDEESLIEISLDDGHYVGAGRGERCAFREKGFLRAELLPDLVLHKRDFIDILSEISEEDSLIEIDIARGSIKCSNFGIKA